MVCARFQFPIAIAALVLLASGVRAGPVTAFVGHTSPHSREVIAENFSRPDKDGNIRPVSIVASDKIDAPDLLSGTIYYMVFERDDKNPADPWGTGMPTVLRQFRPGIDFNGGASPGIDDRAKYLYVYQVINHQRTTPKIESASIKLLVDHSAITSWGYFHGLGFASKDADGIVRPLSATYKIDQKTYQSPAPQVPISQPLMLADVPTSRGEIEPMREGGSKIVRVQWDALDPAVPPDTVMILGASDFNKHPSFRAIWSGNNAIGKGGRSTVFGFTSNLPPKYEPARLRSVREAVKVDEKDKDVNEDDLNRAVADKEKIKPVKLPVSKAREAIRLAKLAEDEATSAGESVAGVEGRVPTPFPVDGELAFAGNRGDLGENSSSSGAGLPLGGTPMMGGGGGSSGGGSGGGFFPSNNNTGNQGGSSGGGGIQSGGGGTSFISSAAEAPAVGSGTGVGTGTGSGEGVGVGTGTSSSLNNININFNVSQLNQQSQNQYQFQNQKQNQDQSQNQDQDQSGGGGEHVVPEPASLIGLTLGLPALFYAYRRRNRKTL